MDWFRINLLINYKFNIYIKYLLKKKIYWKIKDLYRFISYYYNHKRLIILFLNKSFFDNIKFQINQKEKQKKKTNISLKKKKIFFNLKKKIYLSYKKRKKIKLIIRLRRKNLFLTLLNVNGDVILKTNIGSCGFKKRVKFTGFALQNTTRIFAEKLLEILQKEWKKNIDIIWKKYENNRKQVSFYFKKKKSLFVKIYNNIIKENEYKNIIKKLKLKKFDYKKINLIKYYNRFEYDKQKNIRFLGWAFLHYMGDKRWRKKFKNGIFIFKRLIKKILESSNINEILLDTNTYNLIKKNKKKKKNKIKKYKILKKIKKKKILKIKRKKKKKINLKKNIIFKIKKILKVEKEKKVKKNKKNIKIKKQKKIQQNIILEKIKVPEGIKIPPWLNFFLWKIKEKKKLKDVLFEKKIHKMRNINLKNDWKIWKTKGQKQWRLNLQKRLKKKIYFKKKKNYKYLLNKKKLKFNLFFNFWKKKEKKFNYILTSTKKKEVLLNYIFYKNYKLYYRKNQQVFERKILKHYLFLDLILKNNLKFWSFRFIFKGFRKLKYKYIIMHIKNKRPLIQSKGFRLKKKRRL